TGMLRKKWIAREDVSQVRDASRTVRVAVLREAPATDKPAPKLNENQQTILVALTVAGGRARVEDLNRLEVPRTTLQTLVRRGVVEITKEQADFSVSGIMTREPLDFDLNVA